jgi:hypothetical protein
VKTYEAHLAVLGAGPAGTGPLFAALRQGRSEELLKRGVRWLDAGGAFGCGAIGDYKISSDTQASVLLECLPSEADGPLGEMLGTAEEQAVRSHGSGPLPLVTAGAYLARLGEATRNLVVRGGRSAVHAGFVVDRVEVHPEGFLVHGAEQGAPARVFARCVLSALGGVSSRQQALAAELPDGRTVASLQLPNVHTTDELFRSGVALLADRLATERAPRIAVLGGSHSAYACTVQLLARGAVRDGMVTILARRMPKIFYPSAEAARADGYRGWDERDICPVTGRVFRLAGLRLDARELVRRVQGLGGLGPEPRVRIVHLAREPSSAAADILRDAHVAVLGLGYRPRTVPFFADGQRIALQCELSRGRPMVDGRCRILAGDGSPIPGAFGIGLASGFVPSGAMGGEPSFDGQTNGLWLYQNDVGALVLDQVLTAC